MRLIAQLAQAIGRSHTSVGRTTVVPPPLAPLTFTNLLQGRIDAVASLHEDYLPITMPQALVYLR
jgi:hypothetical protein